MERECRVPQQAVLLVTGGADGVPEPLQLLAGRDDPLVMDSVARIGNLRAWLAVQRALLLFVVSDWDGLGDGGLRTADRFPAWHEPTGSGVADDFLRHGNSSLAPHRGLDHGAAGWL